MDHLTCRSLDLWNTSSLTKDLWNTSVVSDMVSLWKHRNKVYFEEETGVLIKLGRAPKMRECEWLASHGDIIKITSDSASRGGNHIHIVVLGALHSLAEAFHSASRSFSSVQLWTPMVCGHCTGGRSPMG
ncbi:hypothetical protein IFM89_040008 [Coptis chinensis]|uniref:Uncharacterized protein n=1 Tax=Coptis chinensis TaxID=261450 RepID=A0A835GVL4_9MAGN|nr:hypothetical protein IFM89_040008 [Coptis chinensis]